MKNAIKIWKYILAMVNGICLSKTVEFFDITEFFKLFKALKIRSLEIEYFGG